MLLACLSSQLTASDSVQAFVGGRLIPIEGDPIDNGVLIVRNDKIERLGSARDVDIPDGADIHDASGKVIMPGLICTHSHIGRGVAEIVRAPYSQKFASTTPSMCETQESKKRELEGSQP